MTSHDERHARVIDEAVNELLARASNSRALTAAELRPRVVGALEKYIFRGTESVEKNEVRSFIGEMRADELCLIIACERGDEQAWSDLVANFDSAVKSAARKISSNNEDAEDLASSIWAELYGLRQDVGGSRKSKLAYYSGRGSLAGWLRAVVSQLAVDGFRRQSKFVQIEDASEFERVAEESSNHTGNQSVLSHAESPEAIFSEKQTSEDVARALKTAIEGLNAEDRLILKLYYFDDLKLKDIARTFGYHEATASRRVARLHADIRKAVEKALRERHGWSETEVKRHLSDTAEKLGVSVEKLFAALVLAAVVQELLFRGVQ